MARLKVFRTPIGFHDAYVAASSRKAALAAWGADKDLFARGIAEEVTDTALTKAPLANPGEVVKVSRGGREEQLAALPDDTPRVKAEAKPNVPPGRKPAASAQPKPSRAALDTAEDALAGAQARHEAQAAALVKEEAALEKRRRDLKREQRADLDRLEAARDDADQAYRAALAAWRSTFR